MWSMHRKFFRLTNLNLSVNFDLGKLLGAYSRTDRSGEAVSGVQGNTLPGGEFDREQPITNNNQDNEIGSSSSTTMGGLLFDEFGYSRFDVPWSLRIAYNFYYSKVKGESVINQNMTMNGTVTLTKNWGVTFTTGYDFMMKEITMTRIGISRDLHCWEMSFNWIPTGYLQSWDFTIRVKASVLKDLKYERRKDFHDNY